LFLNVKLGTTESSLFAGSPGISFGIYNVGFKENVTDYNALAPRVLRTGARIAGRLGSKWYAVYVETPHEQPGRINARNAEALQQNIRLAESLGATVVCVKAERPAEGLIAFAQREGVTHVIFGQSARSRWELVWRGSTLDRFLAAVPDAAVQVVPFQEA
jgi:two-component system sensor histidine kinase KdpD